MNKNSYTTEEAAEIKGCSPQAIREQIKANLIPGCICLKKGKNWYYNIPKIAFDNHLRGTNAVDIENIKSAVKVAFFELVEDLANQKAKELIKNVQN